MLYVTNDTPKDEKLRILCRLRDRSGEVLHAYEAEASVPALSAVPVLSLDLESSLSSRRDRRQRYMEYSLLRDGRAVSCGTTLFVRPKTFDFLPARIRAEVWETGDDVRIALTSDCFAKSVCLSLSEGECLFSDNWFDLHGDAPVTVSVAKDRPDITEEWIRERLRITAYNADRQG
ncbi:MAG: hypothetical protein J5564_02720 [Clostridia bacterium]|nr:hypothetical protein [Clostridia bacterium]